MDSMVAFRIFFLAFKWPGGALDFLIFGQLMTWWHSRWYKAFTNFFLWGMDRIVIFRIFSWSSKIQVIFFFNEGLSGVQKFFMTYEEPMEAKGPLNFGGFFKPSDFQFLFF